jgi:hypothetical protein
MSRLAIVGTTFGFILLAGCASMAERVLDADQSQAQLRSMQTRVFATTDRARTIEAVVATMQDLGFVISEADATIGAVSGARPDRALRMTVGVYPRGESKLAVRANAQLGREPVVDPKFYQQFFSALGKSLFLSAEEVD